MLFLLPFCLKAEKIVIGEPCLACHLVSKVARSNTCDVLTSSETPHFLVDCFSWMSQKMVGFHQTSISKKRVVWGVRYIYIYIYIHHITQTYIFAGIAGSSPPGFFSFCSGDRKLKRLICQKLHPLGGCPLWKLGSMASKWVRTYFYMGYIGVITH